MRAVSRLEAVEHQQCPQQQTCSAEHDDGDGNLPCDDCAAQPTAVPRGRSTPGCERRREREAGHAPGRHQAEQEADHERRHDGESGDPAAEAEDHGGRQQIGRNERSGGVQKQRARDRAEQAAKYRQHQALGEQLCHDTAAPRAERRANGKLARPRCPASQHQVGDIGTAERQHEPHHTKEKQ